MENVELKNRFIRKANEAMQLQGWSKAELARRMGVSAQFVGQYLGSENPSTPGLDVVERFARALGLEDPGALIDDSEISQVVT